MVYSGRLNPTPAYGSVSISSRLKRSRDIEMLILGVPFEALWVEEDALGETRLLSGFDLVENIRAFIFDGFKLSDLNILKHLNGFDYEHIDYAERRHFDEMLLSLNLITYDSNSLLKCVLVERINQDKYGSDAAQLSRNIIFPACSEYISNVADDVLMNGPRISTGKNTYRTRLRLQRDIALCLLIFFLIEYPSYLNIRDSQDSYIYSRSHSLEYSYENPVDIDFNDDLDFAVNKFMWSQEKRGLYHQRVTRKFEVVLSSVLKYEHIVVRASGRRYFASRKTKNHSGLTLPEHMIALLKPDITLHRLESVSTMGELLGILKND
ncbi:hypothetical protein TUM17560_31260 [Serratia marcescens]|nr:hypothetical protein TUM17560_31260 [Serratia marcescens]